MEQFFAGFWARTLAFLAEHQMKLIQFVAFLVLGYVAVRIIRRIVRKAIDRSKLNSTLGGFLKGLITFSLDVVYIITLLSILGVPMTTFIAMLSAAGLAIALALQGNLSNFASGIMIVVFKPFVVGDLIESQGTLGFVREIQILYTHLLTPDNRKVIIPNSELTNSRVLNYTVEGTRRIDLVFGVGYGSDIGKVKQLLAEIVGDHASIHREPEPVIRLGRHNDSSLDFDVKVWVDNDNYWQVHYDLHEQIKQAFDAHGIEIPYPKRDVTLIGK